jgi:hypothetical protein
MLTSELTTLQTNLSVVFARLGNIRLYRERFGIIICDDKDVIYKELLVYQWILSMWQQYEDGTPYTDNFISKEDFDIMTNRIKLLIET